MALHTMPSDGASWDSPDTGVCVWVDVCVCVCVCVCLCLCVCDVVSPQGLPSSLYERERKGSPNLFAFPPPKAWLSLVLVICFKCFFIKDLWISVPGHVWG